MEQWIRVERKIAVLFDQHAYSRCATASGVCEAIHATIIHRTTRCLLHDLSDVASRRSRQSATIPTSAERGYFAGDVDRKGATRPKVDGRAADRQLQGSDRQARD
jgi:hypothetical protein